MLPKLKKLVVLVLILRLLFPAQIVQADTGPKPTMDFAFEQEQDLLPMSIASGIMYECDQADCSDASPLKELGPQGFRCNTESCNATAYGFAAYHRLEIQFSDGKIRQSNIFKTAGFDSKYTVIVRPDDLLVKAQFNLGFLSPIIILIISCVCGLVGVGLVMGVIVFLIRRSKKN